MHEGFHLSREGFYLSDEGQNLIHRVSILMHEGFTLVHRVQTFVHDGSTLVHGAQTLAGEGQTRIDEGLTLVEGVKTFARKVKTLVLKVSTFVGGFLDLLRSRRCSTGSVLSRTDSKPDRPRPFRDERRRAELLTQELIHLIGFRAGDVLNFTGAVKADYQRLPRTGGSLHLDRGDMIQIKEKGTVLAGDLYEVHGVRRESGLHW